MLASPFSPWPPASDILLAPYGDEDGGRSVRFLHSSHIYLLFFLLSFHAEMTVRS